MTVSVLLDHPYGPDVYCLTYGDATIYLVGTAHVCQDSVALVRHIIETTLPDRLCLELDRHRYQAMCRNTPGQFPGLKNLLQAKQFSLLSWLMLAYQQKLANKLGVSPGAELLAAAQTAERLGIPYVFCDRDARITLARARQAMSFRQKVRLFIALASALLRPEKLTTEQLGKLKSHDGIANLIGEWAAQFPALKRVIIDERDIILAENIKAAGGERLVAIVGAGHIAGILRCLAIDNRAMLAEFATWPPQEPHSWLRRWRLRH